MKKIIILLIFAIMLLVGCDQKADNLMSKCCEQCNYAANRDTRAFDIRGQACNDEYYLNMRLFEGDSDRSPAAILSQDCVKYFNDNPTTVSGCW